MYSETPTSILTIQEAGQGNTTPHLRRPDREGAFSSEVGGLSVLGFRVQGGLELGGFRVSSCLQHASGPGSRQWLVQGSQDQNLGMGVWDSLRGLGDYTVP